jgi:nitrogenase molybdenum-iron protein NifN
VGFPIHDRVGANRQLLLGYRGTMALLDLMINALLEKKQAESPIGFSYL